MHFESGMPPAVYTLDDGPGRIFVVIAVSTGQGWGWPPLRPPRCCRLPAAFPPVERAIYALPLHGALRDGTHGISGDSAPDSPSGSRAFRGLNAMWRPMAGLPRPESQRRCVCTTVSIS